MTQIFYKPILRCALCGLRRDCGKSLRMELGKIIRNARKAKNLSLEDLAHMLGSDSGNLSRLERGIQSTTLDKLKQIMSILDIKLIAPEQIYSGQAFESSNVVNAPQPYREARSYPLINWHQAGKADESPLTGSTELMIESTEHAGNSGYWLKVDGHSMTCFGNPTFPEGSLILVKPNAEIVSGKYYVVEMNTGEKTFKQYVEDAGCKYLRPLNDRYRTIEIDDDGCRFIGRVVDAKMAGL